MSVDEEGQVVVLLKALPLDSNQIIIVLEKKDHVPKLEDVISSIQEEDTKLKHNHGSTRRCVFLATSSKKTCFECNKKGHHAK